MKTYTFALIGTGTIAHTHAEAIELIHNATLIGCYSRTPEKAQLFSSQHNCLAYTSLEEMLSNSELDIVIVCTPSGDHLDSGLKAMRYKKHVIIEKPLETTIEKIDELINFSVEQNIKLTCIFQSRFTEAARELKKAVEQERFGKITMADAIVKWYRTQEYYDSGKWRGTWNLDGGGALMNQSIHAIDLLQWLIGKPKYVQAIAATLGHERIEVEDTAAAVLKFKNGAIGTIQGTTAAYPGFRKRIEINGTHGSVVMEDDFFTKWTFKEETPDDEMIRYKYGEPNAPSETAFDPTVNPTDMFALQIADFIESIEDNRKPFVTPKSARNSVEIILGIYKSANTLKPFYFS